MISVKTFDFVLTKKYNSILLTTTITDRNADTQEHSSHHHDKSDNREINVTEGENSSMTPVNNDIIKFI